MKRINVIIVLCIIILSSVFANAQDRRRHCNEDRQRIKSEKIAYLTDQLDLSVAEAQAFWPLYNEFTNKADALFEEERSIKRNLRHDKSKYSDNEMTTMIDRLVDIAIERAALEKEYHNKYKEVLPATKIVLLYEAEFGFRRHLLRKYKSRDCPLED